MTTVDDSLDYDYLLKTLLIGNSGVGKTCLLKRMVQGTFNPETLNTIGVDFEMQTVEINGKKVKLQIWDTAGQERFANITTSYYRGANSIMLVFDVTIQETFDTIRKWLGEVERFAAKDAQVLLVANKIDLTGSRVIPTEQIETVAKNLGFSYVETSAATDTNVKEAFLSISKQSLEHKIASMAIGTSDQGMQRTAFATESISVDAPQRPASDTACCHFF